MTCDELRERLEEYALGALDEREGAAVEAHLSECDGCPELAREYASIVSAMPVALATASPKKLPAGLKTRVLARLEPESRLRPVSRPARIWLSWRAAGVALAVVIMAVLIALTAQLSVALAQERALRAEYANLVDQQELVLDVIDSPKTVRAVLRSTNGSPAYGKLFSRPDMNYVVAMIARLPMPPPGQSYQLWLTSQGQMKLAGALNVNAQGFGLLVYQADRNGPVFESARVILQSATATQPVNAPLLIWDTGK